MPATAPPLARESESVLPPVTAQGLTPEQERAFVPVRWRLGQRGPTYARCWVLAHLKGGTGKSTSAGVLALRLAEHTGQPVLLIDADIRSQTITAWKAALGDAWPGLVRVETWPVQDLAARISAAVDGPNPPVHIVIDTGGHDVMIVQQAIAAGAKARRAQGFPTVRGVDVIMPLAPSDADALVVGQTFEVVKSQGWLVPIRFRALLTGVSPRGYGDADYIRVTTALSHAGLGWFDTYIPHLVKHLRAVGTIPRPSDPDSPRADDAGNYDALLAELLADEPLDVMP